MAREATITQEQVNSAADTIRAGGGKPTARAVRDQLGGGSMATVLKFLQAWQAGQIKPMAQDIALPPALQRILVDFVSQEVAAARADLEPEIVALQQAQADLIAESERQASHIEALSNVLEETQAEKAEVTGRLVQMESDLSTARDDAHAAEQAAELARTELAKAQLRLESMPRLEKEIERLLTELSEMRESATASAQSAAVFEAKMGAAIERAAATEVRETAAQKKIDQAELQAREDAKQIASLRLELQTQQTALEAQSRELAATQQSANESRVAAKEAGEVAAELRGRLAALATPSEAQPATPAKGQRSKSSHG